MNTKNNKRRRNSVEKIEKAFVELLQSRDMKEITVSDICKTTGLNRSTFYANYMDIYDLADKFREKLERDFALIFLDDLQREQNGALKMFRHIKENQIFYKTYFKLAYDEKHQVMVYDTVRAEKILRTSISNIILRFSATASMRLSKCGSPEDVWKLPKKWPTSLSRNTKADNRVVSEWTARAASEQALYLACSDFFTSRGAFTPYKNAHLFRIVQPFTVPVSIWMKAAFKETNRWKNRKPTGWQPPI